MKSVKRWSRAAWVPVPARLLLASVLLLSGLLMGGTLLSGCEKKPKVEDPPPQVIHEGKPDFGNEDGDATTEEGESAEDKPAEKKWGEKVADLAKAISIAAVVCNDKYLKALEPDELLVGKPALVTSDGVVTVMDKACSPLSEEYATALTLLENKNPQADELLRHWSLLADQYSRVSRTAINIGASAKRRQLNASELKAMLPVMTKETIPAVMKAAVPLLKYTAKNQPGYDRYKTPKSPAEALDYWKPRLEKTMAGLLELEAAWTVHGHDLLKGKLFPRKRHLAWLASYWNARLARENKGMDRITMSDETFGSDLRESGKEFQALAAAYLKDGWGVAMEAFADKTTIDEEKLKAGRKALAKAKKNFEKGFAKLKFPKT